MFLWRNERKINFFFRFEKKKKKNALYGAMLVLPCNHKCCDKWIFQRLALWVTILADDLLNYFSRFSLKTGFDISCKLSPLETGVNLHSMSKAVF